MSSSAASLLTPTIFDLRGRIALVSGGGTGIGLMIAAGLAANGAKVYIGGRRRNVLEKVSKEWEAHGKGTIVPYVQSAIGLFILSILNFCHISVTLDVSNRDSITEAKKLIQEKEGKLHILVNKYGHWPRSWARPIHLLS